MTQPKPIKNTNSAAKVTKPEATAELTDEQLDKVNGGSQSSGAGAGKVTFNPFSITRKID